jgi:TPR repeat protein
MPMRQASSDSQPSFLADDVATPISVQGEGFGHLDDAGQSYIYSKFALPRGKSVQRNVPLDRSATADAVAQLSASPPDRHAALLAAPPSPPTRPSTSAGRLEDEHNWGGRRGRPAVAAGGGATADDEEEEERPRGREPVSAGGHGHSHGHSHEPPRLLTANSSATVESARTLKAARSQHSFGPSVSDMTAEEHLAKGIKCHESGSLNESTYHLRHAAKMDNPTAMLLYALACRHGWGMRPNQAEGVQWLKKAAEFASVEIADDEGAAKQGKHVDRLDSKTHKAQFALSIYELGVSHMNGWGIEQDKALALRCFEIAGCECCGGVTYPGRRR